MEKEKKKWVKTFTITFVSVLLIIGVVVGITIGVENNNERKRQEQIALEESQKVTVPNLVGMTYKEAKEEIEKLELQVDAKLGNLEDDDIVNTQDPSAEKRIKKGETVTIYLKIPATIKNDTSFTGATFNKTWTELKKETDEIFDKNFSDDTYRILVNKGKAYEKQSQNQKYTEYVIFNFNKYTNNRLAPSISISATVDDKTDNVIGITYSCLGNSIDDEISLATFGEITGKISSEVKTTFSNSLKELNEKGSVFKNNIRMWGNYTSTQRNIMIFAVSDEEEKYVEENGSWRKLANTQIEEKSDQTSNINESNNANQNATQQNSQMSSSSMSTSNDTGSVTQQNNSNKSTSTNSNNNQPKQITATLNINMKELLVKAKNDTNLQEILKSKTISLSIYVDDSEEGRKSNMYYGGPYIEDVAKIPDTIKEDFTFYITDENPSVKSKVTIIIGNTSTLTKEATLYENEMTFTKTGTYEIK